MRAKYLCRAFLRAASSERGADRTDENLVPRLRVEPKAAYGDGAPSHLRERPTLQFAVAAVGPGALASEPNAKPLDRSESQLAPSVEVTVGSLPAIAHVFGFDVKVEVPPCYARLQTGYESLRRTPSAAEQGRQFPCDRFLAGKRPADESRSRADRLVVVSRLDVQRAAIGYRDRRRVVFAATDECGIRGDRELLRGFRDRRCAAPTALVLTSECRRGHDDGERDHGPQRGVHPPSALIAITSPVPRPTIMNPTLQLP